MTLGLISEITLSTTAKATAAAESGARGRWLLKDEGMFKGSFLCIVIRSSSPSPTSPSHIPQSSHSFVLALNDPCDETGSGSFLGGGTYFPSLHQVINPAAGQLVSFSGGAITHGGLPVVAGIRYILPVFLFISKKDLSSADSVASAKDLWTLSHPNDKRGTSERESQSQTKKPKIDFESKGDSYSFSFLL
jgi:hypothetical protein